MVSEIKISRGTRRGLLGAGLVAFCGVVSRADESDDSALEARIDAAVRIGLKWLASEQQASGAWTTKDYGESTATTSLAMMALMAGGHVPGEGPYGRFL
jgi:hypothetical protein